MSPLPASPTRPLPPAGAIPPAAAAATPSSSPTRQAAVGPSTAGSERCGHEAERGRRMRRRGRDPMPRPLAFPPSSVAPQHSAPAVASPLLATALAPPTPTAAPTEPLGTVRPGPAAVPPLLAGQRRVSSGTPPRWPEFAPSRPIAIGPSSVRINGTSLTPSSSPRSVGSARSASSGTGSQVPEDPWAAGLFFDDLDGAPYASRPTSPMAQPPLRLLRQAPAPALPATAP